VKGCGPKVALSILGSVGAETAASAILAQDAKLLTRAPGVGARLAERIILELKEKIADEQFQRRVEAASHSRRPADAPADELVDALLALGYRRSEAESAADEARQSAEGVEEQLRVALRNLQR
jgi:holliday junction DNA helicase RuvA